MILRKKCLHGIKTSERGNKKKVISEFYGKQNFKGILLFYLIRRSLEFFRILRKNRDDFFGFGLSRLMRGITTSRVSPLLVMTIQHLEKGNVIIGRVRRTDNLSLIKKEAAEVLGSCVASPRMTVEKGYCHLEPRAIARGCKDLINKCRDCIELTRLKQVRIKLKRDLYGDFACAQPLKMTMIICFVFSLGVVSEARAACNNGVDEENKPCGTWDCGTTGSNVTCSLSKGTLTISGEGEMKDYGASRSGAYPSFWEADAPWSGKYVTKAVIEGNVTRIGNNTFVGESYLTEISGTENLQSIGNGAFNRAGITSVDIPNVTHLGGGAFHKAPNLEYVNMRDDVVLLNKDWFSAGNGTFADINVVKNSCITNPETGMKTCRSCGNKYVKAGTGCVKDCGKGYLGKEGKCIVSSLGCGYGYKDMGGFCNRVRYTPAEAAEIAKDDGNVVTLTFKK